MNEILAALEEILEGASDVQIRELNDALVRYGVKYHGSRRRMKGTALKMMETLEQECGYRTVCRDCDGIGSVRSEGRCETCGGSGRLAI